MKDLALTRSRRMSKCSVSVVLIKQTIKVQGRDIGYSLAYDYDNKIFQRMTAIFTQYTVRTKRTITNVLCYVSIQTNDVQRR